MFRRVGVILIFIFGGCGSCHDPKPYFNIKGINVQNGVAFNNANSITNDSIPYDDFVIDVYYDLDFHSSINSPGFPFIPAAMATNPCKEAGYKGTKEKLRMIEVTALSDFNLNYKTGDLLNPVIRIEGLPLSDYINQNNQFNLKDRAFKLTLIEKPDSTFTHSFKVTFSYASGEEHSGVTSPITIY